MLEVPFPLPSDFVRRLGFVSDRRLICLYWEPCGDELTVADDTRSATGLADERVYREFVRRADVWDWLDGVGAFLGSSDREATHWLVVDTTTGRSFVGGWREARQAVIRQEPPG